MRERLVEALRQALRGESQTLLDELSAQPGSKWDNPFVGSFIELKKCLSEFSGFFSEPSLVVFGTKLLSPQRVELEYQLSFWYPSLWRPRIIIPAKAVIALNEDSTKFTSVVESWEPSLLQLFLEQFLPRFWDIWHQFTSTVPEYPPVRKLGSVGKVSLVELPPSLVFEARWTGLAKYPGPPLLTLPGFSFTGDLQTSKPNREPYLPVLPVETRTDAFMDPAGSGQEFKRTSWVVPVPTSLLHSVPELWERACAAAPVTVKAHNLVDFAVSSSSMSDDDDENDENQDPAKEIDFKVTDIAKISIMKSVKDGIQRGVGLSFSEKKVAEFIAAEKAEVMYKLQPRRLVARVEITGEASAEKISAAIGDIRSAVAEGQVAAVLAGKIVGGGGAGGAGGVRMRKRSMDSYADTSYSPQVGLLVGNCKACFNSRAELALAVYEIQAGYKRTTVQIELVDPSEM